MPDEAIIAEIFTNFVTTKNNGCSCSGKLLECSYIENVITKKLLNKYGFFCLETPLSAA